MNVKNSMNSQAKLWTSIWCLGFLLTHGVHVSHRFANNVISVKQ